MGPRAYTLGRRQAAADETRARLVRAARRLLMGRRGLGAFSLEAVAAHAGVTRLTIYHRFGSKAGLLEAVYDDLAERGAIAANLSSAFARPDAADCLDQVVGAFVHFWCSERLVLRRLRSLAVLDPDFRGVRERDARRRSVVEAVLKRVAAERGPLPAGKADLVAALTSFETCDALAGETADEAALADQLKRLVRAALEMA